MCKVLWAVDGSFLSYEGFRGGFEELWNIGGSAGRYTTFLWLLLLWL
jgi:hypothetical protein